MTWSDPRRRSTLQASTDDPVARFHELYYDSMDQTWMDTHWLGVPTLKCPLDLWIYQEILYETRPDLIIETGTAHGGSALFLASMLDLLGAGSLCTIDVAEVPDRPVHPRVRYVTASSTDPGVVAEMTDLAGAAERVMVLLDSDHSCEHVRAELRAYAGLVTPGCYLIVEDTNVNGRPVLPEFGPGPAEALESFLMTDDRFEVDTSREKLLMTFNPGGFLRRRTP
ncbi:MAG: CmcI family methyltransferase [Candidatus Dormibacteraceae bacterium]